ncbi:MAG: hypothetical protein HOD43_11520 [Candidatus Marinimicrobia bacterium]|nr:hypothetical protein [Candidatus Neomarinimicrobiota bacterium]MBT3631809.1 hypothetical protein [Candidatus Neomarinimicrobiota bacterium]MBT3825032.1 hypothetical protein [Candidatus Neomarinimicrobiota bacterium]MBT4130431.1 hypothetical protein [Candidatus Neomarinimicrobiota bacterium]MBT4296419.1 hypothetical protein [Candidatus Neomarinimicrobiota bacterium]
MMLLVGLFFLTIFSPGLYAQEEDLFGDSEGDSLLFGDEFDLGGDDFSFETEEESGTESEAVGEDDFFGDFGDEEETEAGLTEEDTTEVDEWGLETDADYESLITRTTDGDLLEEVPDHPLELGKYVKGTIFEDTGFTLSLYSPQVVPDELNTWFSYMDISLTTELPWHFTFEPIELSFSIDISSFNFVNSFPVGGDFKGFSIMPLARAEIYGVELELGLGMYTPTFGAMAGIGYSYQFHSLFFSAGYRWNWAYNIDPIGSSWWLEPRFTTGIKFW